MPHSARSHRRLCRRGTQLYPFASDSKVGQVSGQVSGLLSTDALPAVSRAEIVWVCLLYDDGPAPRPIEPLLIFTDVEVPVGIEVAAQV